MEKQSRPLYAKLLSLLNWKTPTQSKKVTIEEEDIKKALTDFFKTRGYCTDPSPARGKGGFDLVCFHPKKEDWWIIEAKTDSGNKSVDFPQVLGQLLLTMKKKEGVTISYGIAVPNTTYFTQRYDGIPRDIIEYLQWHCFFVSPEGNITIREPANCHCLDNQASPPSIDPPTNAD